MAAIARAIEAGQIDAPEPWLLPVINQPRDVAGLLAESHRHCAFHQSQRCSIQSRLGHAAIPLACQHFPRVCLIDDRGVFVTLSHYCPTAASLLTSQEGPIAIVSGPEPVPNGTPEGFDARGAWPPLVAPNVLMDLESYSAWESHQIAWLGGERNPDGRWSPEAVLEMLAGHADRLSTWRPGRRALARTIQDLASDTPDNRESVPDWDLERRLRTHAIDALPASQEWPGAIENIEAVWHRDRAAAWRADPRIVNRFLAAHAFASWTAYQSDTPVTNVRQLQLTLAVLRAEAARVAQRDGTGLTRDRLVEAIRRTDLLLVHLVDRQALVASLKAFGGDASGRARHI